jgi:hypothetical protein
MTAAGGEPVPKSWEKWINEAASTVRSWEAERGTMLTTRDAAMLTEWIAHAIDAAVNRGSPR